MTSPPNPWPPTVEQLAQDLAKVLTVGVGRPLRGKATINALEAVAAQLSEDESLPPLRQVEDAIRESIQRLGDGALAKAAALDFGVAKQTAHLRKALDRRGFAMSELGVQESALKESHEPRMCLALAKDLLKRLPEMSASEDAPSPTDEDEPSVIDGNATDNDHKPLSSLAATEAVAAKEVRRAPRLTKAHLIAGALLGCAAVAGVVALTFRSPAQTASASIPPPDSIVNTWTGRWTSHIPTAKIEYAKGQIEGGEANLRGCDISAGVPCAYLAKKRAIDARLGDIIEIKYRLYDSDAEPIPYVKLNITSGLGKHEAEEIGIGILVAWPVAPNGIEYPAGNSGELSIRLPAQGSYALTYIPGSTTLTSSFNRRLLYHLPDGIMSGGIGLEDVGSPSSCFECADEYERIVSFRARVT